MSVPLNKAWKPLLSGFLGVPSTTAQTVDCAWTDLSCTATSDQQLHGLLLLILIGLVYWRSRVRRTHTATPTRRVL